MVPAGVTIHFARLTSGAGDPGRADGMVERTLGYLDSMPAAARALADVKPGVVVLAHTGVSYLNGFTGEAALLERLAGHAGAPALTAARAVHDALAHLRVRRLALATPYPEVIATAGRRYWEAAGFDLVAHQRLDGVANIYEESEARAYELGRAADVAGADAVLISGTGLPTAGIVDRLERDLGKPVVTSQTASLWRALAMLGAGGPVRGYGRLLAATASGCGP
jgi:maleate cis-trans isomerase